MKKFLGLTLFLFVFTIGNAQTELKWYTDLNEAVKVSQKEKKPIMLFFTGSDWCGWCHRLQNEVFTQDAFKAWATKSLVLVEVDFPRSKPQSNELKEQNNQLQRQFGVRGYPTVWFVTPENTKDGKVNLTQLGSSGYKAGGAEFWVNDAKEIIKPK